MEPEGPQAQLTKNTRPLPSSRKKVYGWKRRVTSDGCVPLQSSQDEEVLQAANGRTACAVASFTLWYKVKDGQSLRLGHVFLPSHFFHFFFLVKKRQHGENQPEEGGGTDCLNQSNFYYDTQTLVSALCFLGGEMQFDFNLRPWVFVGETQVSHCILILNPTAV